MKQIEKLTLQDIENLDEEEIKYLPLLELYDLADFIFMQINNAEKKVKRILRQKFNLVAEIVNERAGRKVFKSL